MEMRDSGEPKSQVLELLLHKNAEKEQKLLQVVAACFEARIEKEGLTERAIMLCKLNKSLYEL